jgi:hypothetical protein
LVLAGILLGGSVARGATFVIVNNDTVGVGFNDAALRVPVGGNTGTTLGQQRLNAFQFAANIWGAILQSNVPIKVGSTFHPQPALPCHPTSAQLGQAGPAGVHLNFAGALLADTLYPRALANSIAGTDLSGGANDVDAQFSDLIDSGCFKGASNGWYYGLDGNPPANQIDLIPALMHELCHGLGFLTFVDLATGARPSGFLASGLKPSEFNDVFMLNLEDHSTGALYPNMTDAQRVAASTNTGNLHWVGPNVEASSAFLTAGRVGNHVLMYAPPSQVPGSSVSHFDTSLTPDELMEPYATAHPLHVLATELLKDIGWTLNATATPTPTPTPTPVPCVGDCNGGGTITVDEILTMVNIGLGNASIDLCRAGDANGDGQITGDEILTAVNNALNGCR